MTGFLITSGSRVDSVGGLFYVFPALSGKRWAESGVRVMSDRKSRNFYVQIFFVITFGLLISGCNDVYRQTTNYYNSDGKLTSTETKYVANTDTLYERQRETKHATLEEAVARVRQVQPSYNIEKEGVRTKIYDIRSPETKLQTSSVEQDILSTGNTPAQIPVPLAACNFLFNNNNVCTNTNVTTATAIVSVAVLGGIIAGVLTAVNNKANSNEQRQKDNDLLLQLYLLRDKSSGARVCYDSAVPPNVIPCP